METHLNDNISYNGRLFNNTKKEKDFVENFSLSDILEYNYNYLKEELKEKQTTIYYNIDFQPLFALNVESYPCPGAKLLDEFYKLKLDSKFIKNLQRLDSFGSSCFIKDIETSKCMIWLLSDLVFIITRKHYRSVDYLIIDVEVCHVDHDEVVLNDIITNKIKNI